MFSMFRKKDDETFVVRDIDELFDKQTPRWKEAYYAVWRFFKYSPWGNPRQTYSGIKWFIQRGRRGWSDRDVWSLDHYLTSWLPAALRKLKADKHGVPSAMFRDEDGLAEDGNPTEEAFAKAKARWDSTIDSMIKGFEAEARIADLTYEDELGDYPLYRPAGVSKQAWKQISRERFVKTEELRLRDEEIWQKGIALFAEYYRSLWD